MFDMLREEIHVVFERDPAVKSTWEVIFCYPGFHAILNHRLAHWLYNHKRYFLARLVSHISRMFTGIDIHPGAKIGRSFFIDHGSGVVIGETAEVGDFVTLYQGVTLGGTGKEKGKRHPTLGNNITVSAGAKLLGSFTVGDNVKIGGGSVVLRDIPANCTVVGVPGRIVRRDGLPIHYAYDDEIDMEEEEALVDLNHQQLPDPEMDLIRQLEERIALLEARVSLQHEQLMDQLAADAHRKKEEIVCRS